MRPGVPVGTSRSDRGTRRAGVRVPGRRTAPAAVSRPAAATESQSPMIISDCFKLVAHRVAAGPGFRGPGVTVTVTTPVIGIITVIQ